jgi:hypothetical protein
MIVVASWWSSTVAIAESVVGVLVLGLIVAVLRLRDRVTRLESLDELRRRRERDA